MQGYALASILMIFISLGSMSSLVVFFLDASYAYVTIGCAHAFSFLLVGQGLRENQPRQLPDLG
jgi:hypothetical protein